MVNQQTYDVLKIGKVSQIIALDKEKLFRIEVWEDEGNVKINISVIGQSKDLSITEIEKLIFLNK